MDNELLYCVIENRNPYFYFSLYLSIFLPFKAKFVLQFSSELCKQDSSNIVYICRMSDYIMGLRLRIMAFIFLFLSIFLSFPILHVNIKFFMLEFSLKLLKLECLNLVYTWTMSCCIVGLRIGLLALILLFICPFFCFF